MTDFYNDPYDPTGPSTGGETPTMDRVVQDAIDAALIETHTCLPGQIVAVKGNTKCDVKPLLKRRHKVDGLISMPIIQDVPICFPAGADWWVKCPVSVGDTGIIFFAERSIDKWLVAGGEVDPADIRKHDIADAMFYPGLLPFNKTVAGDPKDMVLHNGSGEITIKKEGKFKITNGSNELIDLISKTVDQCSQIANAGGPAFNAAQFTALKALVDTLKV